MWTRQLLRCDMQKHAILTISHKLVHESPLTSGHWSSLLIIGWRLHLVDPVPLPACDFDGVSGAHCLFQGVNGRECRHSDPQNDQRRNVKEAIFGLHQQLVVAPENKSTPWPKRQICLGNPPLVFHGTILDTNDETLAALLHNVLPGHVVH